WYLCIYFTFSQWQSMPIRPRTSIFLYPSITVPAGVASPMTQARSPSPISTPNSGLSGVAVDDARGFAFEAGALETGGGGGGASSLGTRSASLRSTVLSFH